MKNIKLLVATLLIASATIVSCKKETAETTTSETKEIAKAETTTMNIEGMTCAVGCAKVIENKLTQLEGVKKASINFESKVATIEYDAAAQTPEKLVETIEAVAGGKTYKVSNVKNSADKAMYFQEKPKKNKKSKKEATVEASATSATVVAPAEKKGGCCASKKSCSAEKPATL